MSLHSLSCLRECNVLSVCLCRHFTVGQSHRRLVRQTRPKSQTCRVTEVDFEHESVFKKKKNVKKKTKQNPKLLSWGERERIKDKICLLVFSFKFFILSFNKYLLLLQSAGTL